jgi:chromosome segregation ATPase
MLALDHRHLSERNASLVENQTHLEGERDAARRDLQATQRDQRFVSTQVERMGDRIDGMGGQISALQLERDALRSQVAILEAQRQSHAAPLAQVQGVLSSDQLAALGRFLGPQPLQGGNYVS